MVPWAVNSVCVFILSLEWAVSPGSILGEALTQFRMQFANDNFRHLHVAATSKSCGLSFGS
jgi:hypothetical protein